MVPYMKFVLQLFYTTTYQNIYNSSWNTLYINIKPKYPSMYLFFDIMLAIASTTYHPFTGWMMIHLHVLGHVWIWGQQPASRPWSSMDCRGIELFETQKYPFSKHRITIIF